MKDNFPPRVLRWEHTPEGTTLDFEKKHDIFLSSEKICSGRNYKHTDEYLSLKEHNYLMLQLEAETFENVAHLTNRFNCANSLKNYLLKKVADLRKTTDELSFNLSEVTSEELKGLPEE